MQIHEPCLNAKSEKYIRVPIFIQHKTTMYILKLFVFIVRSVSDITIQRHAFH